MLTGGLDEWKERILFPSLGAGASEEDSLHFLKIAEVSKYFGGTPQTGVQTSEVSAVKQMPKLQSPAGNTPAGVQKKKKKEGC